MFKPDIELSVEHVNAPVGVLTTHCGVPIAI